MLYLDGARFISTHSVSELIREASQKRPELLPLRAQAVILEQYYLTTRYPDAVAAPAIPSEIFTKEQAEEAYKDAEKVLEFVKKKLPSE